MGKKMPRFIQILTQPTKLHVPAARVPLVRTAQSPLSHVPLSSAIVWCSTARPARIAAQHRPISQLSGRGCVSVAAAPSCVQPCWWALSRSAESSLPDARTRRLAPSVAPLAACEPRIPPIPCTPHTQRAAEAPAARVLVHLYLAPMSWLDGSLETMDWTRSSAALPGLRPTCSCR